MKFSELEARCEYVADDTGNFWKINENQFAIVRRGGVDDFCNRSAFVVFEDEDNLTVVAVNSYLDVFLSEQECIELAEDAYREKFPRHYYDRLFFTRGD